MSPSTPSHDALQVIVVEDDPDSREILHDVVRALGHGCRPASNGLDAWKIHQANRADLIIADWQMPELGARIEAAWRVAKVHRELQTRNCALRVDSARNHQAARTDPLTAVSNRLRLEEDLATLAGRGLRYGHRYCAAQCDVDAFEAYNDCFGHLAGDEALCRIARTIQKQLRSGDSLYR